MMKVFLLQFFLTILSVASIAQSIDLQEDTTVNNLYDSRQGSCSMSDIDNDGDLDLLITGADAGLANRKTTLYSNNGLGNFTEITETGLSNWSELGHTSFADVDGDGDQDLFYTGRDGSPNYYANLYLNDGNGNFTLDPNAPFEPSIEGDFEFEDVDNDGDLDLFMTGYNSQGSVFSKLYKNSGTGSFSEVISSPFESAGSSSVAFFDMDGDNDKDLIVSGSNNNNEIKTNLYENDGFGNFSLVSNTPFENVSRSDIAIADSDNDGDLDILINGSNESFQNICNLYLNDGTGSFSLLAGTPFITSSIGTADFADFDNDNDMDILITGSVGGADFAAHIYENHGMNNFNLSDSLIKVYNSTTAIGDIDGDNDLDVIIVGISNELDFVKPRVYKNMLTTTSIEMALYEGNENALIYPNPSSGIINIESENTFSSSIKIYNTNGELVFSDDNLNTNNPIQLNQSPGLYLVVIKANNTITTSKLMIK